MIDPEVLRRKGWPETDIEKTFLILNKAVSEKPKHIKFLDKAIYWIVLLFMIFINLATVALLAPLFLVMKGVFLFFVIFVIGIVFGWLFSFMIHQIEDLDGKDHVIDGVFIVAMALISITVTTWLLKSVESFIYSPVEIGVVYIVAYIIPYGIRKTRERKGITKGI